jgi:hypothetical protein
LFLLDFGKEKKKSVLFFQTLMSRAGWRVTGSRHTNDRFIETPLFETRVQVSADEGLCWEKKKKNQNQNQKQNNPEPCSAGESGRDRAELALARNFPDVEPTLRNSKIRQKRRNDCWQFGGGKRARIRFEMFQSVLVNNCRASKILFCNEIIFCKVFKLEQRQSAPKSRIRIVSAVRRAPHTDRTRKRNTKKLEKKKQKKILKIQNKICKYLQ